MPKTTAFKVVPAPQESEAAYTRIVLRDMAVDVCIGVNPDEQGGRRQRVLVNVELYAALGYLRDASPDSIIDYSKIIEAVKGWETRAHTLLVETYMSELLDICFSLDGVEACRLSILKTEVCKDAAGAGVEVFMTRADYGA